MYYDDLLLEQLFNDSKNQYDIFVSETGLVKAILYDAIEILQGNVRMHLKKIMKKPVLLQKHTDRLMQETKEWILDDKENKYSHYMFSFIEVCEYLHLDPCHVRDVLRTKNLL